MAGTTPASPLADVDGCAVASGGCAGWCRDTAGASTAAAPPDTSCRVMARLAKVGHGPAHLGSLPGNPLPSPLQPCLGGLPGTLLPGPQAAPRAPVGVLLTQLAL